MPPASSATRRGTRKLSEVAKHLVVPQSIAATGWPDVAATCRHKLGIEFDDWQDGAGRVMFAKRADGTLAAMVDGVGLSLPRQVGKTYLVGSAVFALCVNMPGLLVIWSAHHARTHGETFLAMQGFAKRAKVAAHIAQVYTGSGDEEIRFVNGSRILFGARERGFGRGIPGVDVLIFDEAQILSDRAMANMLATMNTSDFGLQLYIGTPPKPEDMAEAFTRMRTEALAGTLADGAWIEFGAADDAKDDDRAQWRKANPSYPKRTPMQSMLRLKRKLTDADWRREGLGIWDPPKASRSVFPADRWADLVDEESQVAPGGYLVFAVDVSWDRSTARVGIVGTRADGLAHLEQSDGMDPASIAGWLRERVPRWSPLAVGLQWTGAPVSSLANDIDGLGFPVHRMSGADVAKACGSMHDAIVSGRVRHLGDPNLHQQVETAVSRRIGEGWALDRRDSPMDISGLVAVTEALWILDELIGTADYDVKDSIA